MVRSTWKIGVGLCAAAALVAGVSCSGDTTSPSASSADATTAAGGTIAAPQDFPVLSAELSFVHPVPDPQRSASAAIDAAVGGEVVLQLDEVTTATLTVPAEVLPESTTLTVSAVGDLGDGTDDPDVLAVEVSPSMPVLHGFATLVFTSTDEALTATFADRADAAYSWDDDGVLGAVIAEGDGSSLTLFMQHFSGAGTGGGASPPRSYVKEWFGAHRDDAGAAAADLEANYLDPMTTLAAQQCYSYGAIQEVITYLNLGDRGYLGDDWDSDAARAKYEQRIDPILTTSLDCARKACKAGDTSAGGKFIHAVNLGQLLGSPSFDDLFDEVDPLYEEFTSTFQTCMLYEATVNGVASAQLRVDESASIPVTESFVASGVITPGKAGVLRVSQRESGWGAWMSKYVTAVYDVFWEFGLGMAKAGGAMITGMGYTLPPEADVSDFPPHVAFDCQLAPYADVDMPVSLTWSSSGPDGETLPTITMTDPGIVTDSTCTETLTPSFWPAHGSPGSTTFQWSTLYAFDQTKKLEHLADGRPLSHAFTLDEFDGIAQYVARHSGNFETFLSTGGDITLTISLRPVKEVDPKDPRSMPPSETGPTPNELPPPDLTDEPPMLDSSMLEIQRYMSLVPISAP